MVAKFYLATNHLPNRKAYSYSANYLPMDSAADCLSADYLSAAVDNSRRFAVDSAAVARQENSCRKSDRSWNYQY